MPLTSGDCEKPTDELRGCAFGIHTQVKLSYSKAAKDGYCPHHCHHPSPQKHLSY